MKLRTAAWGIIAAAFIVIATTVAIRSGDETTSQRTQRLGRELACPVCTGESVGASNSSEARAMRKIIQQSIKDGESDGEIKARFVAAYGERVLLEPDRGGLGVLVWGLPIIGITVGAGGLYLVLRRWSRAPRLVASDADERLVEKLREDPRS